MPVENGRLEIGDYELLWMKTIEVLSILNDEIRYSGRASWRVKIWLKRGLKRKKICKRSKSTSG